MCIDNFEIIVVSRPHRENLVAEVYYNKEQWVEISQENKEIIVQFYPPTTQDYWEFPFDMSIRVLEKARNYLLEG